MRKRGSRSTLCSRFSGGSACSTSSCSRCPFASSRRNAPACASDRYGSVRAHYQPLPLANWSGPVGLWVDAGGAFWTIDRAANRHYDQPELGTVHQRDAIALHGGVLGVDRPEQLRDVRHGATPARRRLQVQRFGSFSSSNFQSAPARETIEGTLARSALEGALTAQSATITVCETEIALSDATSKRLTVFVEQLQSEAKATRRAAASGSRLEL
jgi:hypothetical protein